MRRFRMLERLLAQFGIERGRFVLDWVAAGESDRFQKLTSAMGERIRAMGPLRLPGYVESEVLP
jgi:coenzyme F420-reducing hydrogenase delta subunit